MPVQPTYPGVYVEEISSGVRTITGVATSITAFIGRALSGPVNEPVTINSYSDFQRQFGGLWLDSTLGYAVQDFYANGGSQAIIVRVENDADTAEIHLPVALASPPDLELVLLATSAGSWANNLFVSVNHDTQDPTMPVSSPPVADPDLFNLLIYEQSSETMEMIKVEEYLRVSLSPASTSYLPRVLDQSSTRLAVEKNLFTNEWVVPAGRPEETTEPVAVSIEGTDGEVPGDSDYKTGIDALQTADLVNLVCIPPPSRNADTSADVYSYAITTCVSKRAMLLVDPPADWGRNPINAVSRPKNNLSSLNISGPNARNAALYYPLIRKPDPLLKNHMETFVPCGAVAGVMAATDTTRGVWKSPAGIDAALNGVQGLQVNLTDPQNGDLNKIGINCLRAFPDTGRVVWGARTMRGADSLADEYKYIAVRRTALFIEETLYRGTKWVVFEPNDEPLWGQIRLNIGAFMHNLFRQGAFQGKTPKDAYLVKCDSETTTQNDINLGIVNILVGFAPLKPAEFVIIKLQQLTGQIDT